MLALLGTIAALAGYYGVRVLYEAFTSQPRDVLGTILGGFLIAGALAFSLMVALLSEGGLMQYILQLLSTEKVIAPAIVLTITMIFAFLMDGMSPFYFRSGPSCALVAGVYTLAGHPAESWVSIAVAFVLLLTSVVIETLIYHELCKKYHHRPFDE